MTRNFAVIALAIAVCVLAIACYLVLGSNSFALQGGARVQCSDLASAEMAAGVDRELTLSNGYQLHIETYRPVTKMDGRVVVPASVELYGSRSNWEMIKSRGRRIPIRAEIEAEITEIVRSRGGSDPTIDEFHLDVSY